MPAPSQPIRYDYDAVMQRTATRYFTTAGSNAGNDPVTGDVSLVYDRLGRTTTRGTGYKTGIPGLKLDDFGL